MKLDITTIILTYNEELHIRRCLENVCSFSKRVIVVDSPSNDRTIEIINDFNASLNSQPSAFSSAPVEVIVHKYPGNQAEQFNWALDNIQVNTEWILRIDADEYLLPELVNELQQKLPSLPEDVTGIEFKRRHIFMGRWMKHGIYPVVILRMCRTGKGRYENRMMDEHYTISEGRSVVFDNDFCDHSLINISDYCRKHLDYARREAAEIILEHFDLQVDGNEYTLGDEAKEKRKNKAVYNRLPLFWRSFAYFFFRYFIKRAFLDGKEGFLFTFIQGWWYRTMVDAKVLEAKKHLEMKGYSLKKSELSEEGRRELRTFIQEQWGISL